MAGQEGQGIKAGDVVRLKSGGPKMTVALLEPSSSAMLRILYTVFGLIEEERKNAVN
jgi:hypothetical protein